MGHRHARRTSKKVELSRLARFYPENLGLIGVAAYRGNPSAGATQLFTFNFDAAAGFEFLLDHLSRPDQVQRSASADADAERLTRHGILWYAQFGCAGAILGKPAKHNHQADVNYFTHS